MSIRPGRTVIAKTEEVVYGQPAASAVPELARRRGARRVLVMASGTLNRTTDAVKRVVEALGDMYAATFDTVPAHTPRSAVIAAAALAREFGIDTIVCLSNDVTDVDAMDPLLAGPVKPPTVRSIAVPTTLSAGEFSAIAGVTNEKKRAKELFNHPLCAPAAVVLDAEITLHTPQWLFISTGIRAVDHCVEGYCSSAPSPYADGQALHALKLLSSGLLKVTQNPQDLDARLQCLIGCWLSMTGVATGVPMGCSHGIGYVLGGAFDVPHGHTSCVMLPAVMKWNKPANAARQADIVAALGGKPGDDAGDLLHKLIAALGMPRSLKAVGVGKDKFAFVAMRAMKTNWVPRNPRKVESQAQVLEILEMVADDDAWPPAAKI
ncbi:iron-containing alcohol dehydrogenase [Hyaloraphidium curvatum]|nr:iron-containing alcohol dehydrogenase [Hyaloraphidium curvatum]